MIRTEVLESVLLHTHQHIHRVCRCTDTALLDLTEIIQKTFDEKEVAICVFIDVEGAFDISPNTAVKRVMERKGINSVTSRLVCNLLSTRKAENTVGERIIRVSPVKGWDAHREGSCHL